LAAMEYIFNYGKDYINLQIPKKNVIEFKYPINTSIKKSEEEIIEDAISNPFRQYRYMKLLTRKKKHAYLFQI
jgi:nickel-dependent lactate racemase